MYKNLIKRFIDLILAIFGIPFLLIIFIIVAPIIYFEDKGPIFYNALRVGKNGIIFKMFKFRTMKVNAPDIRNKDGSTYNDENDSRLTRIGKILRKTSLDEIPQLLNVLIGNMSFIGPRPDLPEHLKIYSNYEKIKLTVLPGISGYNQAYFRNSIEFHERLKNDVYYAQNVSFLFDIKIFFKTIFSVLNKKNIFISNTKYKISKLEWDTKYFGIDSGRIDIYEEINLDDFSKVKKELKKYEFLTIVNHNNNSNNNKIISTSNAFLTDINVQFKNDCFKLKNKSENIITTNKCKQNNQMLKIAANAYKYSRFINDPMLEKNKSKKIYYFWLKNSFDKENKIISYYEKDNKVEGYCLYNIDNNICTIELIAVNKNNSKNGIGSKLIQEVKNFCIKHDINMIKVGTQLDNIEAQNFYFKNGFKIAQHNTVYHMWGKK